MEYDNQAPYFTENNPTGRDRKSVEGPLPTNEDFPNSWLPTEKEQPEEMAVEQIEVINVVVQAAANEMPGLPGVPRALYLAWEGAHDAEIDFAGSYDPESLDRFVHYLVDLASELTRMGLPIDPRQMDQLKTYIRRNPPDRGPDGYSPSRAQDHLDRLDQVLSRLHDEAIRLTGTEREHWYEYQAEQMKRNKQPLSEQEMRTQRGPGAGFIEELWNRKRKHELRGMRVTAAEVLPGVSSQLFNAWKKGHEAKESANAGGTISDIDRFAQAIAYFGKIAEQAGVQRTDLFVNPALEFVNDHPPRNGMEYDRSEMANYISHLDQILSGLHQAVLNHTGTRRSDWYALKEQKSQDDHEFGQVLTPEEQKEMREMGMPVRLTPQQQMVERGPFLQDLWERKRFHEMRGMRVRAVDVKRPKVKQDDLMGLPQEMAEGAQPAPAPKKTKKTRPHPAVMKTNNMAEGHENVLSQPLINWSWEDYPPEESGIAGSLFSYQKMIHLYDFNANPDQEVLGDEEDARLECYAFVEPLVVRQKRLLDLAERTRRSDPVRAQELQTEARNTPDRGYINDIEVFYKDELLFHRERSFTPSRALSSQEFMASDTLQRAVTDLQQYIRTTLDPTPVGQFIQRALEKPGKGPQKLSKKEHVPWWKRYDEWSQKNPGKGRIYEEDEEIVVYPKKKHKKGEVMKVTAADVLPYDPSKRRLKSLPKVNPVRPEPRSHVKPFSEYTDQEVEDLKRELDEGYTGLEDSVYADPSALAEHGVQSLDLPGQGNPQDDYEAILYMYDNVVGGLNDIAQSMIGLQPTLPPDQQKESGKMIAKLRAAIRALSA